MNGSLAKRALSYLGFALVSVYCLAPFYWMTISAFRRPQDQFDNTILPVRWSWENFSAVFAGDNGFGRALLNSVIVAGSTTVLTLLIGTFTAYALARLNFRFKNAVLGLIIATTMFPGISQLVPLLKLFTDINWINTYQAMVVPSLGFALPLSVWLLTAFFRQLPFELEQAAWAPTPERLAAYTRPDELHQAFNFHYLTAPWEAPAMREVIDESLRTAGAVGAPATWVLSNHDVKRHVTRYDDGERGLRRARAAALLTLALPGSSYVYQGEELGLPEVLDLPEEFQQDPQRLRGDGAGRDGCRVPMPWEGEEPPFGFGAGAGSWLPIPTEWRDLTAAAQRDDPGSMLALYTEALRIRRGHPALGDGSLRWLDGPAGTLLFVREAAGEGRRLACAVNLGGRPARVRAHGTPLLASGPLSAGGDHVVLPPDTAVWWDVEEDD